MSATDNVKAGLMLAAAAVGVFIVYKASRVGAGLISGDNAITNGAKDSNGKPVDAYKGVPIIGTLGAATNDLSGGYLATFGGWLGRTTYDLFHPEEAAATTPVKVPPVNSDILDRWDYYTMGGRGAASGSGSVLDRDRSFEDLSRPGLTYFDYYP